MAISSTEILALHDSWVYVFTSHLTEKFKRISQRRTLLVKGAVQESHRERKMHVTCQPRDSYFTQRIGYISENMNVDKT
jgi:ABC-type phosphate transport system ATPase subunit